ncbi:MAG: prefoldin subunit alpha [Candidatus ainarchaeum sp.]|nr:prefoldin subunit alpha [Candidatus ainarchaeum sp.]MDD5096330.1 prefoldin subunit alpha [Candidatus ainarchaeum sp.]
MEREEIVARARMVGQQRNYVEREIERMMLSMMDLNNSLTTIQSMKDETGLVPIGGGAFIRARLDPDNVLVPIGAGYITEFGVEAAKAEIDKRIKMTEKAVQSLRSELKKMDDEFMKLEQLYSKHGHAGHSHSEEEGGGS